MAFSQMLEKLKENDNVWLEGKIDSNMKNFFYKLNYNTNIRKIGQLKNLLRYTHNSFEQQ